jgi:hypothetical protein
MDQAKHSFDESYYLSVYPDVAEAVRTGIFTSGWEHYLRHGIREGRSAAPGARSPAMPPADQEADSWPGPGVDEALLARKAQIEAAMRTAPDDFDLRLAYFGLLRRLSQSHFGPFVALLPEIRTPLFFRAGSSDLRNLEQIYFRRRARAAAPFEYGDYGFPLPAPRRALDLGAYCGYFAVYLANRFPMAEIVTVEPPGPNFDMLVANTALYPCIRRLSAAAWRENAWLGLSGDVLGDWGTQFAPTSPPDEGFAAYSLREILRIIDWGDRVDLIKCVTENVTAELLAGADRPWLQQVSCVLTRSLAGAWGAGEEARLRDAFPEADFSRQTDGEVILYRRASVDGVAPALTETLQLIPPMPAARSFTLRNVLDHGDRFYTFRGRSFQLVPNPPGQAAAAISLRIVMSGQARFATGLIAGPALPEVAVDARLTEIASGAVIAQARRHLSAGADLDWQIGFAPASGLHEILLTVEQLGEGGSLIDGWLRFFEPRLEAG